MKLLTELSEKGSVYGTILGMHHDAAAAHALLQAIDRAYDGDPELLEWLKDEADKLMTEWGFERKDGK